MSSLLSQSCEFVKKRDDTVLRVVWNGDLQLLDKGPKRGSARRRFLNINGQECKEPKTIDTKLYTAAKGTYIHRPAYGGWAYRVLIHIYFICFIYNIQKTNLLLFVVVVVVVVAAAAAAAAVVVMAVTAAAAAAAAAAAIVVGGGGGSSRAL